MRRFNVMAISAVMLLAAALFLNTLDHEFVYDDKMQIAANPLVRDSGSLETLFATSVWAFKSTPTSRQISNYYRPVFMSALALSHRMAGLDPMAFHLVSILFHMLCSALVYALALQLLGAEHRPAAAVAAALFAAHPIHTESVAWISGLTDPLCGAFCLAAILCHIESARSSRPRVVETLAGLFSLLGLLSKEIAIAVPVVAFVHDRTLGRSRKRESPAEIYVCYALAAAVYLGLRYHALDGFAPAAPSLRSFFDFWLANLPAFLRQCLEKSIWPVHQSVYHVFAAANSPWQISVLAGYLVLATVVAILAFWRGRRADLARFLVAWFVLFLLPLLPGKVYQPDVVAERYLYLPSVAVCIGFAAAGAALAQRWLGTAISVVVCAAILSLACWRTVERNTVWQNEETLYETTLLSDPDAHLIRLNLGVRYLELGRPQDAIVELRRLESRAPGFKDVHLNLGIAYHNLSDYERAEQCYLLALRQTPPETKALFNLAHIQSVTGRPRQAIATYRSLLAMDPGYSGARFNLGLTLVEAGEFEAAIPALHEALARSEASPAEIYVQLGLAYRGQQLDDAALEMFRKATQQDPAPAAAFGFMANLYYLRGDYGMAVTALEDALARDPDNTLYRQNLGAARKLLGEPP